MLGERKGMLSDLVSDQIHVVAFGCVSGKNVV